MADQANISSILAALAAQRPGGTPSQVAQPVPQAGLSPVYPSNLATSTPPAGFGGFALPQPTNTGSLDLSSIRPVNSGSVSIADAIAKAKGIAAEKGLSSYDPSRGSGVTNRDSDPRLAGRSYRRSRSRSRSPTRMPRESFRDNYNPYRDERRDDRRGANGRDYGRDRSYSPGPRGRHDATFSPPPSRSYGGRGDRSPRGEPADDNVETIQIESGLVGLIIGRQGENLRRVESETGTRVQFITGPDAMGPIRQCRINGTRAARAEAKAEIYRIIDENGSGPKATSVRPRPGVHQPALREGEDSMQIMVPDRTVGLIIGRGGETIRDLQDRSGCHVNIVGESKSVNGLRPVNLIGSHQAAMKAKDLIMEIVDSDTKTMSGPPQRETPRNFGYAPSADPYGAADKVNDTIIVPSEAVGMIIGKGGETIKEMQSTTSCKINVSAPSGPTDIERDIGLVGTRDAIEMAKKAIMEKVETVQQKNRPSRPADPYADRYSQAQQPYGSVPGQAMPAQAATPVASSAPGNVTGGDGSDPYAPYGGYQNYVAMWYAAMAQQQQMQQQGQGQGEQPKPPGTA
ncbi:hypothetical protein L228DRAFT_270597 [Xylona heveae TC161]|uniref:K Homology domain-containing protein n=1 Tax=Xylona heveae (strain CBS 132557 / TC161) TaxID=1328760 RepID=A0A165A1D3_XYLHT|nr:hypothetical protein L228DRAFT_270597 [Xylona heveae TC161]KZF19817.1 hypothetical protein L228DRAFT_270597 [Xylona heveae TC161]